MANGAIAAAPAWSAPNPSRFAFQRIEAVRSDWQATAPPATGWTDVALPDVWTSRWPGFDGVVWYRLTWEQPASGEPLGLMVEYWNMAGAIYLNGILLASDESLVEPLTRSWNTPRYWTLASPAQRPGTQVLLIRVSGLSAYDPGLGLVTIGEPAAVSAQYARAYGLRHDLPIFSAAVTATLGCFFMAMWLMRRENAAYGWFGLMSLGWLGFVVNQLARSPWPFPTTHRWQSFIAITFLVFAASFAMFVLRYCERPRTRFEAALWSSVAAGAVLMLAAPASHLHEIRLGVILLPCLLFLSVCLYFLYLSARSPRADLRILSVTIVAFFVAGLHDMAVFFGVLDSNIYYTPLTSQFQMIGMALMLAWHFVTNVRRIERFNIELAENVEAAKCELSAALHQQHKLELSNARLGERLNLARDLHDGLGGTLVSSIATLEHAPAGIPPRRFLSILKELRDDLRLIIDTASSQQDSEYALGELLAPLRHRLARLLEDHGIEGDWRLAGLDRCHLSAAQSLDVLRILQEGLTNVVKHSGASRVAIALLDDGQWLELTIADNGHGFCPDTVGTHPGTGLPSMRARAARLGSSLQIRSGPAATTLSVRVPRGTGPR